MNELELLVKAVEGMQGLLKEYNELHKEMTKGILELRTKVDELEYRAKRTERKLELHIENFFKDHKQGGDE